MTDEDSDFLKPIIISVTGLRYGPNHPRHFQIHDIETSGALTFNKRHQIMKTQQIVMEIMYMK